MRIGLVIEHFDPRRGGAEQWTGRLADWLAKVKHEVHVVCQSGLISDGLAVHRLGRTKSRLAFAQAAEVQLRRLALEVVHDMGAGWFGDLIQSHDGSRVAQWDRKLLMLPPSIRPFKRALIACLPRYREFRALATRQYSDPRRLVVAMSQAVADDYQRYHGLQPSQIRIVYHGVDTERYSPAARAQHRAAARQTMGYSNDEVVLLLAAHNFALKGLATLIRALGRLRGPSNPFRLAVVGGGKPRPFLRLAGRCGVSAAVRFFGSAEDMLPYYSAADAYVQPTFYDSFGLTVLESAACGLPVVTTEAAGVSELLTDGEDGYVLANAADDAALAERLETLADSSARRRMGAAARRLAERHTFLDNCRQIAALYQEAIERHR